MAKETVLRGAIKFKEITLSESLTDRILCLATDGTLKDRPAVDTSTFLSTALASGRIIVGSGGGVATAVNTASVGDVLADTTNGLTIKAGAIVNADVNSSAGIVYTKLNLANSIVNADIAGGAAIVYSKLNLSGGIVNGDINASAGITRSKLASGTAYRILVNNASGVMSENAALTASRAIGSDANGQFQVSATTFTQLGYSSNLTGDIQSQLDNEIATRTVAAIVKAPTASEDGYAITWSNSLGQYTLSDPVIQGIPIAGSTRQVLLKNSGTNYDASWDDLEISDISDIDASAAEINVLDGILASTTELNYSQGVTSSIQTQFNNKLGTGLTHNYVFVGNAFNLAAAVAPGTEGYIFKIVGGTPTWSTPPTGTIGGSTGSVDNVLLRADGTGGSTLQTAPAVIDDNANFTLGNAALGGASRIFAVQSSAANVILQIEGKGSSGAVYIKSGQGLGIYDSSGNYSANLGPNVLNFAQSATVSPHTKDDADGDAPYLIVRGAAGANPFNVNGGDLFISGGDGTGTGVDGNIAVNTVSLAGWNSMEKGMFIGDCVTPASAAIADGVTIFSEDAILKTWNDIEILDNTKGIILTETGGAGRWRIAVSSLGVLSASSV